MTAALILLANGVEEMEAVIVIDTFRRAKWKVTAAGVGTEVVIASRGVRLLPDVAWSEIDPEKFDVLVIPGGQAGTEALAREARVLEAVRSFVRAGKWVAAICAGPLVLQAAGVLTGRRATCHPAVVLTQTERLPERVVVDGRLITSQGPGTTLEFALAIVREIEGPAQAAQLAQAMLAN